MIDPALESLVHAVLAPLSDEIGEDPSQTTSPAFITIRNQFNDSNRDFRLLFEAGRDLLTNVGKDLWGAWALVGGLLWSKQYDGTEGFVASCQVVRGLVDRYWGRIYPESRGLKNTLLTQINKWWNTFAVRCTENANKELLRAGLDELVALRESLLSKIDGATEADKVRAFSFLGSLPQVIKTLSVVLGGSPEEPSTSGTVPKAEVQTRPTSTNSEEMKTQTPLGNPLLDEAYEGASQKIKSGAIEDGLNEFQSALTRQGGFSEQFRGRVMLGELYLQAGLTLHAKRVLQYTHDEIDKIRLPDWEPKLCSRLWSSLIQAHLRSRDEKPNDKLLSDLFAQLCRLDPKTAASLEPIKGRE